MKKLAKRIVTDTPKWVKYAQGVLAAFAAYQAFVAVNPDLLNVIPPVWAPKIAGISAASAFFLQLINKK